MKNKVRKIAQKRVEKDLKNVQIDEK